MKSASVLISNFNDFEMIELCIESVRKFTDYPHKIIVYDDASAYVQDGKKLPNEHDLNYLRACRDKGWITLIEGEKQIHHGGALNVLLNEACDTDYAAILDGDIQIRAHGWLTELIKHCQTDKLNMGVCNFKDTGYWPSGYRPGSYLYCMGLMDMNLYRDGMQVDWNLRYADRAVEPYLTEFASLYPPEENKMFTEVYMKHHGYTYEEFDRDLVILDPGCTIHMKVRHDNPKGYKIVPEPPFFGLKYRHWVHCSSWLNPNQEPGSPAAVRRETMLSGIRKELVELRGK